MLINRRTAAAGLSGSRTALSLLWTPPTRLPEHACVWCVCQDAAPQQRTRTRSVDGRCRPTTTSSSCCTDWLVVRSVALSVEQLSTALQTTWTGPVIAQSGNAATKGPTTTDASPTLRCSVNRRYLDHRWLFGACTTAQLVRMPAIAWRTPFDGLVTIVYQSKSITSMKSCTPSSFSEHQGI